jgi:4-hydroxyphenylacetate 3-monooxygenase
MIRTGAQYIESLRDARTVFVDGARVADVTEHPAFRAAVRSIAGLYDLAAAPEHRAVMTVPSPATGDPVNASFLLPRTPADLAARRRAHRLWAEATFGLMGRSPDHVPGFITGFALRPDLFARAGPRFGEHVVRYHAYLRDRDLYASYAIIPPIVDRSKPAHRQEDPTLYAGVVEERPEGIVVSVAQMLGTGAAISNEIFASCINPLQPGDENYALSFAVPAAAPGLRMIVRRPYAEAAPSVYDYPLSSRFDETDALVIFDRVFVPWERVFVYRDVALTRAQFYDTPAHLLGNFQAQVRFAAKAEFLAGLAVRIAEATGVAARRETETLLGELASYCGMAAGLVVAAESACVRDPRGFVYPNPTYLYANNWLQATYYQTMVTYLRELSGGGLLQVPSSYRDYLNPEIASDLERFVRSPGLTSVERVKLAKLAWDLVGSEFAGRHQQYELFYAGGRAETTSVRAYRAFDFAGARAMVERCLAGYDLPAKPSAEGEPPRP